MGLVLTARYEGIDSPLEIGQGFGYGGVEYEHGRSTVGRRADGAELETVTGEGKGRGPVAVGVVDAQVGNLWNIQFDVVGAAHGRQFGVGRRFYFVEHFGNLAADKG